jgi:phosphatidate cytidylyltransferase
MLKERVLTAIVLVVGFLAALAFAPASVWLLLIATVSALAAREWAALNAFPDNARWIYAVAVALLCVLLGWNVNALPPLWVAAIYALSAVFWMGVVPWWMATNWRLSGMPATAAAGMLVLLPSSLALLHLRALDAWLLLAAMALVWIADVAAYFTGRAFGRRKLAPSISPGKTREGALGAIAAVLVLGLALRALGDEGLRVLPLAAWLVLLPALTALSIVGDLFESLMKRQAGVKDSGTLLPGHGGVLDRIDSLTATLPLVGLVVFIIQWPN